MRRGKKDPFEKKLKGLESAIHVDISSQMDENIDLLKQQFANCSDLVIRRLQVLGSMPGVAIYLDVLVDSEMWDIGFLQPLMLQDRSHVESPAQLYELLGHKLASTVQPEMIRNMGNIIQRIVKGEIILFVDSFSEAYAFKIGNKLHRNLEEPTTEAIIRGPRFGFIEKLDINIAILRQRLRTPRLKMERMSVGSLSHSDIAIVYIEGYAKQSVVDEVKKRISKVDMDSVLESGYLEEFIDDHPNSPFPTIQSTQRPDVVAGSLIEGKVAVLIDGTPMSLVLPITFWFGFQTAEDYYMSFIFATMLRWLRYMFAFLAMALPAMYIGITSFQQEMIPTSLALSLAAAREVVPFPVMAEALIMEITFEALREAGIRLPRPVGQTISIVGALVIGQAAVQAGIISAPMIIVVATTGIASFLIPNPGMSQAISLIRFPLMILGATLGLYGVAVGLLAVLIHLVNMSSFGTAYMTPIAPFQWAGLADSIIRAPWRVLRKRHHYGKHRMD